MRAPVSSHAADLAGTASRSKTCPFSSWTTPTAALSDIAAISLMLCWLPAIVGGVGVDGVGAGAPCTAGRARPQVKSLPVTFGRLKAGSPVVGTGPPSYPWPMLYQT